MSGNSTDYEHLQIQIKEQKEQVQKSEALIATRKKSEERLQTLSDEQSRLKEHMNGKKKKLFCISNKWQP